MICEENKDFSLSKDECGPGDVTVGATYPCSLSRDYVLWSR